MRKVRCKARRSRQRQPVDDGAHGVLAHTEMQIAPAVRRRASRRRRLDRLDKWVFVDGRQVRRAADKPGNVRGNRVQRLAGGVARGHALAVGGEGRQGGVPVLGKIGMLQASGFGRRDRDIGGDSSPIAGPGLALRRPRAPQPAVEVLAHPVRHQELGIFGPTIGSLGQPDFLVAKRLAVGPSCPACAARHSRCGC